MTSIVTVPQAVAGLTQSLNTSTSAQNAALQTAMVNAGIIQAQNTVQACFGGINLTNTVYSKNLGYTNGTDTATITPIVFDNIGTATNYGSWNTSPISFVIAIVGNSTQTITFPANSVFTFSRNVIATATFGGQAYTVQNQAGGNMLFRQFLNYGGIVTGYAGGSSQDWDAVHGVSTITASFTGAGQYRAGDQLFYAAVVANLQTDGITVSAAQYGSYANVNTFFTIVNHN